MSASSFQVSAFRNLLFPLTAVNVMRHFLDLLDVSADELNHLLADAAAMKGAHNRGQRQPFLAGRVLGLVFEEPSVRTRARFDAARAQRAVTHIFARVDD